MEHPPHLIADVLVDDPRARHVVAVLRGVRDRVAHEPEASAVHEVDDQLHLVQDLEVRQLGLVARLHQGLEAGLDELADAAAEHRLLAEEVGLGLFLEGRLQNAGPAGSQRARVGQGALAGTPGRVLLGCHQGGGALAVLVGAANQVAGRFGRDHRHVDRRLGLDLAEVDREPVREHQHRAVLQAGLDGVPVEPGLARVGRQDHDHRGPRHRLRDVGDLHPVGLGAVPRTAAGVEPDGYVLAALLQIQGMSAALRAVPEDGDPFPKLRRAVLVVKHFHRATVPPCIERLGRCARGASPLETVRGYKPRRTAPPWS